MATYEYNEEDLPTAKTRSGRVLKDGTLCRLVEVGDWSMEWVSPISKGDLDGESDLEQVEQTILAWIAYRNWLAENPPKVKE
jgi:hypothetical protein